MLKKISRILFLFVALAALFVGMLYVGFHILMPQSRMQRMLADGIRGYSMRESMVEKISVGISGVSLNNFAISQYPNFKRGAMFEAKKIEVRTTPLSFLQHSISEINIDSPKLTLLTGRDYGKDSDTAAMNKRMIFKEHAARALMLISRFNVEHATLSFTHHLVRKEIVRVDGLTLRSRNLVFSRPFVVNGSCRIVYGDTVMPLECELIVDVVSQTVEVKNAVIGEHGKTLHLSGSIGNIIEPSSLTFGLIMRGDRSVLDRFMKVFSRGELVQFLDTPQIAVSISGTSDNLIIKRLQ